MARCPECGARLEIPEDLKRLDHFYCPSCNAELEVLNLEPLELEAIYEFEADEEVELFAWDEVEEEAEPLEEVEEEDEEEEEEEEEVDDEEEEEVW